MPTIPMPSPNGTNYERRFIERTSPVAAYDAALFGGFSIHDPLPITRERIAARNRQLAMDEEDEGIQLSSEALEFLKDRLDPADLEQLQEILAKGPREIAGDPDGQTDEALAMDRAHRTASGPTGIVSRFPHAHRLRTGCG